MKALLSFVFFPISCVVFHTVCGQETLRADTVATDTITPGPADVKVPVAALRNFAYTGKDLFAFQVYAGVSVLNTLRGHIPNLSIGADPAFASGGVRGSRSIVIDGLPFGNNISAYYNLNSFEYESVYALPGGNSALGYGGNASSGVVFLESKSGKDLTRPVIEFNTSPATLTNQSGERIWYLTNALAYAEDFGPADLRVSYNTTIMPTTGGTTTSRSGLHNLRVNSGVDIARNFSARVILDGVYDKSTASFASGQATQTVSKSHSDNLQVNMLLRYAPLSWLTLTSRTSLSDIGAESHTTSSVALDYWRDDERFLANLFATANKALTGNTGVQAYAGIQHEDQEVSIRQIFQSPGTINGASQRTEYKTTAVIGGASFHYKTYLFADATYRADNFSSLPSGNNQSSWSLGASFIFSELIARSTQNFTSGKLRASTGQSGFFDSQLYPSAIGFNPLGVFPSPGPIVYPNPSLSPVTGRTMFETGADLAFLNNRVRANLTWYRDLNDQTIAQMAVPGSSGFQYMYVDLGSLETQGWETVLAFNSIRTGSASLTTTFTHTKYDVTIDAPGSGGGQGISLGDPMPDWVGSMLNQVSFRDFMASFLIDIRSGGDAVIFSAGDMQIVDTSNTMLRDISVGYTLPLGDVFKRSMLSISGRNLWAIQVKDQRYAEYFHNYYRSIALSVTLGF